MAAAPAQTKSNMLQRATPWLMLLLGLAAGAALGSAGPELSAPGGAARFVQGYSVAWFCYLAAALLAMRAGRLPRWVLLWLVLAALGMRIVALERTPPLSTDYWRYVWDGRCINAGVNPYLHRPDAPEVRYLRDPNWRKMNFRNIPTVYPPAAELFFAAVTRVRARDAELFRWLFVVFDMASVLALIALLRRTGRPAERVIWYAWCPLAVTEVTGGVHVDALGLFLLLTALVLAARRQGRPGPGAAVALAAAVLAKGFAVLALPFFVRRGGWKTAAVFSAACAIMLAPFAGAGRHLFSGLSEYFGHWEVNSGLFFLSNWTLNALDVEWHYGITRAASTLATLALTAWLTWRLRPGLEGLIAATFAVLAASLLLGAPTLPWYVIWSLPLLCWWTIPGWVLFTLTVSAQYYLRWIYPEAYRTLLWAGYTPVFALLIGQALWWRVTRSRVDSSAA